MTFSDLEEGTYSLRVIARIEGDELERAIASTKVTVTSGAACAAHLINDGVSVFGARATMEFTSSGLPVFEFRCSLDGVELETCKCNSTHPCNNNNKTLIWLSATLCILRYESVGSEGFI